jgi:DNA replication and repair protein RecF
LTLKITRLGVRDFRCYQEYETELSPGLTVLVGPNATGKTNLLEAVQLLTSCESFRRPPWQDLVRWGADKCAASAEAAGEGREVRLEMQVEGGRRTYRVNGKAKRRLAEVVGILPGVVFVPDDLRMTKESGERRRAELDSLGSQISPSYLELKNEYDRVLRQRNRLLKEDVVSETELSAWTESLVHTGSRFQEARERLFARAWPHMQAAHSEIAGSSPGLSARYVRASERDGIDGPQDSEGSIRAHLKEKAFEERARGTTVAGPHRDDIVFALDGREVRAFASQGQHRSIALSWKLAEVATIEEVSGQTPVLLLDDVMSELDEPRRNALAVRAGTAAQTIMTTTNTGYFGDELMSRAMVVRLG